MSESWRELVLSLFMLKELMWSIGELGKSYFIDSLIYEVMVTMEPELGFYQ